MHEKSHLQFSGLGLCGLSLWTFLGHHKAFLVVIPNYTYQLIVLLTLATACLIFVNALIGLLSVKLQRKCIICLVITKYTYVFGSNHLLHLMTSRKPFFVSNEGIGTHKTTGVNTITAPIWELSKQSCFWGLA